MPAASVISNEIESVVESGSVLLFYNVSRRLQKHFKAFRTSKVPKNQGNLNNAIVTEKMCVWREKKKVINAVDFFQGEQSPKKIEMKRS